ncbi:hypothetical protein [Sphingobium sp. CFD-1]|uniref:hypothetical protein n=1 Tax=Sphingobium sp. CFD-1 TaxID=2878545 RepID=UPI00214CE2A0|nr:hypothetical protein [Sphingobium sp. CFD-1]
MPSDMVEAVAIAIKNARALTGTNPVARLSDVDRRAAIAALKALRDPTPEMVDASAARCEDAYSGAVALAVWSAILSAAIGEG